MLKQANAKAAWTKDLAASVPSTGLNSKELGKVIMKYDAITFRCHSKAEDSEIASTRIMFFLKLSLP